jgi:hypothetical protein
MLVPQSSDAGSSPATSTTPALHGLQSALGKGCHWVQFPARAPRLSVLGTSGTCSAGGSVRLRREALRRCKTLVVARPSKPWSVGSIPTTCSTRPWPSGTASPCQGESHAFDSRRSLWRDLGSPSPNVSSNLLVKDSVCKTVGAVFDSRRALHALVAAAAGGASTPAPSGSTPDGRTASWSRRMRAEPSEGSRAEFDSRPRDRATIAACQFVERGAASAGA